MKETTTKETERKPVPPELIDVFAKIASVPMKPMDDISVSEWADKYRMISSETASQPGPWRTSKTPYMKEIMDAFSDPLIRSIYMVSSSQVGKSEFINNALGYLIDQDPSSVLFIHPNVIDAKDYSKLRIAPMFRDTKVLASKLRGLSRGRGSSTNTILQKAFAGGILTMCGSTEAHALASKPIRYVFGDERDRWAVSAGNEGDPYGLALARQTTFYNAKSVLVSTPTIKGHSPIEDHFYEGTQERWCSRCRHCGEYHNIRWQDIRYEYTEKEVNKKPTYIVDKVYYVCPACGAISTEHEVKKAPAKWIAENPDARQNGIRSFWLNSLISPWLAWKTIVLEYLQARGKPEKLQTVYNTRLGELWEDRGGLANEDDYMARREEYPAELPEGVLVLTCGVDVQDDRLEYEVVGWGLRKENWGIRRGMLLGRPDTPEPWNALDEIVRKIYRYENGKGLRISMTFVDDGGHFTQDVRMNCAQRIGMRVFDCKGYGGDGRPYTAPPKKVKIVIRGRTLGECWQYQLGVDAGKQMIMDGLKIQTPGPRFCHFPLAPEAGYEHRYFVGLLSEHLVYKEHNKNPWVWEKIPGHERNEALDCRNYAMAALTALAPDMDALLRKASGNTSEPPKAPRRAQSVARRGSSLDRIEQRMNEMMDM